MGVVDDTGGCSGGCCASFTLDTAGVIEFDHLGTLVSLNLAPPHPGINWYSCKAWDPATRLCTRYDERPDLCRSYPERGKVCPEIEAGCTARGVNQWRDGSKDLDGDRVRRAATAP